MKALVGTTFALCMFATYCSKVEVNIAGLMKSANGLGQVSINLVNIYSSMALTNFIDSRPSISSFVDLPSNVTAVVKKKFVPQAYAKYVSIFADSLQELVLDESLFKTIPKNSIKYAYTMVESTKIPSTWVQILNSKFDGIVVPDEFLVKVYQDSGVKIPIFVLPIPLMGLEACLHDPLKDKANERFTFGTTAALSPNKNIELLIVAFAKEFANKPNVSLKIHSYWSQYGDTIQGLIDKLQLKNVHLSMKEMKFGEHIKEMSSWDCMVLLSRGEGYSITPRLAMGLGLPCILSNNTAHITLCNTGFPYAVDSKITELSNSPFYGGAFIGYSFNCKLEDVCTAMQAVYKNYNFYLNKAKQSHEWVKRYLPKNLARLYYQLINPYGVKYGDRNQITNKGMITNSKRLFKKYKKWADKTFGD
jgi:glycosyltransferase involved in cell wall biosynthesis